MKPIPQRHLSPQKLDTYRYLTKMLLFLALCTGMLFLIIFMTNRHWLESLPGLLLLSAAMAGLLIAFRWEVAGGLIALFGGLGLGLYTLLTAAENSLLTAVFYSSPFIICGALTLYGCYLNTPKLNHSS